MVNKGLISLIKNIINGRLSFQILFPFCGTSFQCRKKWLVHTWRTFHRSNTGDELLAFLLRMGQTEEKRGLTRLPNFLCVANIYHIISHHITSSVFFGYPPSSCGRWVGRTRTTRQSGRPGAQCLRNCRGRRVADLNVKKGVQTPKMDWHSPLNLMKSH